MVQTEIGCNGENPFSNLSWSQDPLAESFKVMRNGELLAVGITGTEYLDETVASGTHQYIVTAVGFNGMEISSDPIPVIVIQCEGEDHAKEDNPTCKIKTIDSINVSNFNGVIKIENQRPIFTGHTNLKKPK